MGDTAYRIPRFGLDEVAELVRRHYDLEGIVEPLPSYRDQNVHLRQDAGHGWIVKIANADQETALLGAQLAALEHLGHRLLEGIVPRIRRTTSGEPWAEVEGEGGLLHRLWVVQGLPGRLLADFEPVPLELLESVGSLVARVDRSLADFRHTAARRTLDWDLATVEDRLAEAHHIQAPRRRFLAERVIEDFLRALASAGELPKSVIHNDGNPHNLLVQKGEAGPEATGLFDFGDLVETRRVFGLAIACAYAVLGHDEPLPAALAVIRGYHREAPLEAAEAELVLPALRARLATSVIVSARETHLRGEGADDGYLLVHARPAWQALERLAGLDEDFARRACLAATGRGQASARTSGRSDEEILAVRQRHFGRNLSVSYRRPLKIVRGHMQYLFDDTGRPFVDCVNNVCHVGHCHPRVTEAAAAQMVRLNTNTRYLHDGLAEYTERLTALLPDSLSVVFLVCTGSEANDLALRLARTHTARKGVVSLEGAYHGHTDRLIEISPYKHDGPGGAGAPSHVRIVDMPDGYRGSIKHDDPTIAQHYAGRVAEAAEELAQVGHGAAAFIVESMLGCGGQVELPPGYLKAAFAAARSAGAVCIADEVQVGFGRVGTHFWAFETQDVVPDIVTLGKPIGNGHPMAAVVTTPEIAESFANGMEYFNTFGGNPVSCAVGLAVLDVIEEEGLQEHARMVGDGLLAGLRGLAERHRIIGEVRGRGLFIGAELVRDRETLEPAADEASRVVESMKDRGYLLSTDGPLHNVIKIKPPLPFAEENADGLVARLDQVLGGL